MKLLNSNIIDLNNTLYKDGNDFHLAYSNIIEEILEETKSGKSVVYAQQGSPVFLAYTSIQLVRLAKASGLKTIITPGVSSFEYISSELINDYDIYDIQLYNCGSIFDNTAKIDPKSPCILFNLTTYANSTINKTKNVLENQPIELLVLKLQETYPQNHPVCIITVDPIGQFHNRKSNLSALNHDLLKVPPTASIFLPNISIHTLGK